MAKELKEGMGTITITLNYCHVDEYRELKEYLEDKCWSVKFNNAFEDG